MLVYAGFKELNQNIVLLTEEINQVGKQMTELEDANTVIVDNISQISAASEEITASSENTTNVVEKNTELFVQVAAAFNEVNELVRGFDKYIRDTENEIEQEMQQLQ